ncbi:hypothetical protein C8T65DRAFT_737124 [Cerioporus squamosus]|nr:hypothetical protein C8T65DRAFT_737124 [Cerioporus squamosus]
MSSDADSTAADTIAFFSSLYTATYCDLASSVLFLYDVSIIFDREVASFWNVKPSGASLLFFANEWINIVYFLTLYIELAPFPSDKATFAILVLQFVPPAVFSALRAYVLSRSKLLGLLVLALSMSPVGANLVQYGFQLAGENDPPFGCIVTDNISDAISLPFVAHLVTACSMAHAHARHYYCAVIIVSRAPLIVADAILIYVTWTKLSNRDALRDVRRPRRSSLSDILFRNVFHAVLTGTIYFVVLFVLNVLHLAFSVTAFATDSDGVSFVTEFTSPITAILVSRFLLELQEASHADMRLGLDDPLRSSRDPYDTPSFISSLGAFIDPDHTASSDEDEDDFVAPVGSRSDGPEEGGAKVAVSEVAAAA